MAAGWVSVVLWAGFGVSDSGGGPLFQGCITCAVVLLVPRRWTVMVVLLGGEWSGLWTSTRLIVSL